MMLVEVRQQALHSGAAGDVDLVDFGIASWDRRVWDLATRACHHCARA